MIRSILARIFGAASVYPEHALANVIAAITEYEEES